MVQYNRAAFPPSILLVLLVALSGCAESQSRPAATTWKLQENLRIGRSDGDGPRQFGTIDALAVDAEGSIYVLDGSRQEVRIFGADGRFLHAFGREGRGPGEFRGAAGIDVGPDGDVLVIDPRNARYSLFTRDGVLSSDHPRPFRGATTPWAGDFLPDGSYVDWGLSFPDESSEVIGGQRILFRPYRLAPDFNSLDSLPPLIVEREMAAGGSIPMPFFSNRLLIHQTNHGHIWFAHTRQYRLFKRAPNGDTLRTITREDRGMPIGREERQKVMEATTGQPELREAYLAALPARKPVLHHVFSDHDRRVFVIAEPEELGGVLTLDIFGPEGAPLRRLALPAGLEVRSPGPVVAGDYLYAEMKDELDVPHVVRFHLSAQVAER